MSDFQPTPIRYRVWDGKAMHYPEDTPGERPTVDQFLVDPEGEVWKEGAAAYRGGVDPFYQVSGCVPLLSTGLRDADGREVYEGDIVEYVPWPDEGMDPWTGVVRTDPGDAPRVYTEPKGFDHSLHYAVTRGIARVVGNVYERQTTA